jgi:polar amino acid transport system substrate-binding protein
MPPYKAALVNLVKATSIVGYVAVQDLTKVADIVRSRTYEAFFPLIAIAAIYFILAGILVFFIDRLMNKLDPTKRKAEDILKGVRTHD